MLKSAFCRRQSASGDRKVLLREAVQKDTESDGTETDYLGLLERAYHKAVCPEGLNEKSLEGVEYTIKGKCLAMGPALIFIKITQPDEE